MRRAQSATSSCGLWVPMESDPKHCDCLANIENRPKSCVAGGPSVCIETKHGTRDWCDALRGSTAPARGVGRVPHAWLLWGSQGDSIAELVACSMLSRFWSAG